MTWRMGITGYRFLALAIGVAIGATQARADESAREIGEALKQPAAQNDLRLITRSAESLNKAELLHLGMRSKEARTRLVREAEKYVFISVPFWYDDEEGNSALEVIGEQIKAHSGLDFRVMMDWGSPAAVGDFFARGITRTIKKVASGNLQLWNRPQAQRTHSFDPVQNRMHDKYLIVDGRKVLLGGMNIGDEYLKGGLTGEGWHDTDLLLEGPAAQETSKIFFKVFELTKYLDGAGHYPPDKRERTVALQNLFYKDQPEANFLSMDPLYGTQGHTWPQIRLDATIPVAKYLQDAKYFPALPACTDCTVPVRLIYDNPLVDRDIKTGKAFSKTMTTFSYLAKLTHRSLRMFVPYLTPHEGFLSELTALAKRGVEVSLITNSMRTNDLGAIPYVAGVGHYRELLTSGVHIYEWQGHIALKDLEKTKGCVVEPGTWPGATIHTKAAIFDEQVLMLGSHNFNERSESYNNEIMALMNDAGLARGMNEIFQKDVDPSWRPKLACSDGAQIDWPAQVDPITIENLDSKLKKYERQAAFLDKLQRLF